jgi:hypothetical protein
MNNPNGVLYSLKHQCWEDAVVASVDDLFRFNNDFFKTSSSLDQEASFHLDNVNKTIDKYIDSKFYLNQEDNEDAKSIHQNYIYMLSNSAIELSRVLCDNRDGFDIFKSILIDTLIRKQRDYGPTNINKFGITGIIIRMYDKVGRLTNLSSSNKKIEIEETLFDTALDLVGYCAIANMWINNTFNTPMISSKEETGNDNNCCNSR